MSELELIAANQIMVLGGGMSFDEAGQAHLKSWSEERGERTVEYFNAERERFMASGAIIVCTGGYSSGQSPETVSESQREGSLMADYLLQAGIPHQLIEKEIESTSTLQNLLNTFKLGYIDPSYVNRENPLGVVSHPHHLDRVKLLVSKVGIRPAIVQGIATEQEDEALREFLTRQLYRVMLAGLHDPAELRAREDAVFNRLGSARSAIRDFLSALPV